MKTGSTMGSYVKVFGDWWDTMKNDIRPESSLTNKGEFNARPVRTSLRSSCSCDGCGNDTGCDYTSAFKVVGGGRRISRSLFGLSPFVTHQPICNDVVG
jgi:hypothetical protein